MSQIHFLHRNRRYLNGDFAELPFLAYEDYESQTLGDVSLLNGWAAGGIVFTYAGGVAYENFETSTLSNNTPPGPDFGWIGTGIVYGLGFSSQPSSVFTEDGSTVTFSVSVTQGFSPYTYQWQKNGVNLSNGGSVSGATTATLTITGVSSTDYANYDCVVTDAQGLAVTSNTVSLSSLVDDWAARVVVNGGAAPSAGSKTALRSFWSGLISDGIDLLVLEANAFAPDNLIAAITPLVKGPGLDPWTNHNFVSGDLTINGLIGNSSNKYLETGFNPLATGLSNLCAAFYTTSLAGSTGCNLSATTASEFFQLIAKYSDTNGYFFDNQNGVVISGASGLGGFYAETRVSSTDHRAWFANSLHSFSQLGATDAASFGSYPNRAVMAFANNAAGTIQQYSGDRMSFASFMKSMNSTQIANFYIRVQALRVAFGGGYVTLSGTDMANQWAVRVVANGGAAPSGGTKTALATFWDGLITDGLAEKMHCINAFVPDSLIASITPFLVGTGIDPWTNTSFVGGDLTVNGLTGDGSTKRLNSGFNAFTAPGFLGLGGQSFYVYNAPGSINGFEGGSQDATNILGVQAKHNTGVTVTINGNGAQGIVVASPGNGFYSDDRTASTVRKSYFASSVTSWVQIGATDANSFSSYPNLQCWIFALNQNGSQNVPSNDTVSFGAYHLGLSSADGQALYNRVQTLRTSLGGGFR